MISSIEQFWYMYSHLRRICELDTAHSTYHMFREGILPMWEDSANIVRNYFLLHEVYDL